MHSWMFQLVNLLKRKFLICAFSSSVRPKKKVAGFRIKRIFVFLFYFYTYTSTTHNAYSKVHQFSLLRWKTAIQWGQEGLPWWTIRKYNEMRESIQFEPRKPCKSYQWKFFQIYTLNSKSTFYWDSKASPFQLHSTFKRTMHVFEFYFYHCRRQLHYTKKRRLCIAFRPKLMNSILQEKSFKNLYAASQISNDD